MIQVLKLRFYMKTVTLKALYDPSFAPSRQIITTELKNLMIFFGNEMSSLKFFHRAKLFFSVIFHENDGKKKFRRLGFAQI